MAALTEKPMMAARAGSAPMRPTSHSPAPAESASAPGFLYGTSCSLAPSASASAAAMSGATPPGCAGSARLVTRRILDMLMAARTVPRGARTAFAAASIDVVLVSLRCQSV